MTQEQKDLLLQDLCCRIPYGVKVSVNQDELQNYDNYWNGWSFDEEPQEIDGVSIYGVTFGCMDMSDGVIGFEYIKPYLFPLSSMSEEQRFVYEHLHNIIFSCFEDGLCEALAKLQEFYHKHHIDYRGLIPMGLAIDATGLNIY